MGGSNIDRAKANHLSKNVAKKMAPAATRIPEMRSGR